MLDLKDAGQLKVACENVIQHSLSLRGNQSWVTELLALICRVRDVDHAEFVSEEFQRMLWNSNAVSSVGLGNVDISKVAKSTIISEHLWQLKTRFLAVDRVQQDVLIADTWRLATKEIALVSTRIPRLKMYRVFAVLCPGAFTTVAFTRKLLELAKVMGIRVKGEALQTVHRQVMDRIAAAIGPAEDLFTQDGVARLTLPWLLYIGHVQNPEAESTETSDPVTGEERLNPLPAGRRRRGMLAIGGGTATIQAMIEFAVDGCSREDFIEHLQSINPASKKSTLNTQLNALIAEWGVLQPVGNDLQLTPRGEAFLESGDPDDVIDLMITRILGFDNVLYELQAAPLTTHDVILVLRKANPGWTSNFAPTSLINWLRALKLVVVTDKLMRLTPEGEQWAGRIHWEPGCLPNSLIPDDSGIASQQLVIAPDSVERPTLKKIIEGFDPAIRFPDELIGQLDAGLWGHARRHFAVLTGLSGAGKTQLARGYALSMWQGLAQPHEGLLIVPVQPGWHDPSSLLGYLSPLDADTYIRTGVLDFLLRASADPSRPYTLILDEMNLSHPEQYLAPLLSAMETGDNLELHAQDHDVSDVPNSLAYPENLVIIGTVNMDETTHGLSDKVLDRAGVIEFWDIDVNAFPGWNSSTLTTERVATVRSVMTGLMAQLRPVRLHFGWRTLQSVLGYLQEAERGGVIEFTLALDQAIYSKVLPKLRGEDNPRLQSVFKNVDELLAKSHLKLSSTKVQEMLEDLQHSGSARFWR